MGAMQRNKGKAGEREIASLVRDLTGWDVRRRVRQHDGDSDLEGVPGWSIEVKRYAIGGRGEIARWWEQAVAQAADALPVLFYRLDRAPWRAVWPLAACLTADRGDGWCSIDWTADTSIEAWAAVAREAVRTSYQPDFSLPADCDGLAHPQSGGLVIDRRVGVAKGALK